MGLSTAEEGLIRAVVSDPEDDAPRLVYADWLEEQGATEHAEVARLPCAAETEPNKTRRDELEEGLRRTIPADMPQCRWVSFPHGIATPHVFAAQVQSKAFQNEGPPWLRRHRLAGLFIRGATNDWPRLAAAPVLAHVRCLRFESYAHGPERAAALGASPHLARLSALELPEAHTAESVTRLLHGGGLTGLCSLALVRHRLGPDVLQVVADWPAAEGLRRLDFTYTWQGDAGVAVLASSPRLRNLTTLNLFACEVSDAGFEALAGSPHLTRLAHLTLHQNRVTPAGVQALIRSPLLPRLRWLSLEINTQLGDAALALARALAPFPKSRLALSRYLVPKPCWRQIDEALGDRVLWR
jgi:uncharacterized protein (TIGR02996 family)